MPLSEKIIEVCVFSGVMTLWVLAFSDMWRAFIENSGGNYGIGEVFLGFTIPGVVAAIASWWIIKRVRAHR